MRLLKQAPLYQRFGNTFVERFHAPCTFTNRTEQLELIERCQDATGPTIPGLGVSIWSRTLRLHHLQIMCIPLRTRFAAALPLY